nr:argonaute/Dicer protein, PAZ [Tanacetum cinerariifolium]
MGNVEVVDVVVKLVEVLDKGMQHHNLILWFMPPSHGMGHGQGAQPVALSSCVPVQQQTPMRYHPAQSMPPGHGVSHGRGAQMSLPLVASSSKLIKPPARPGFGMVGRKVMITANHFLVQLSDKNTHQYDIV